jgi:hypothetical protein
MAAKTIEISCPGDISQYLGTFRGLEGFGFREAGSKGTVSA